jgi:hypothetical protein
MPDRPEIPEEEFTKAVEAARADMYQRAFTVPGSIVRQALRVAAPILTAPLSRELEEVRDASEFQRDRANEWEARADSAEQLVDQARQLIGDDLCDCDPGDPGSGHGERQCPFCKLRATLTPDLESEEGKKAPREQDREEIKALINCDCGVLDRPHWKTHCSALLDVQRELEEVRARSSARQGGGSGVGDPAQGSGLPGSGSACEPPGAASTSTTEGGDADATGPAPETIAPVDEPASEGSGAASELAKELRAMADAASERQKTGLAEMVRWEAEGIAVDPVRASVEMVVYSGLFDNLVALRCAAAILDPDPGTTSKEGHVCDPERPCEPNDHLCKNARAEGPRCGGSGKLRINEGKYNLGPADVIDCGGCPDCSRQPSGTEGEEELPGRPDENCDFGPPIEEGLPMDPGEILDGLALWDEHKPQNGEDWVKVAERVIADGDSTEEGSALFAAIGIAVRERDSRLTKEALKHVETARGLLAQARPAIVGAKGVAFTALDGALMSVLDAIDELDAAFGDDQPEPHKREEGEP